MADDRARLLELIEQHALKRGRFILSSGRESHFYLDGRMVALHPEGAYLIGKLIFEQIKGMNVQAVGGLTMGADPVASAVSIVSFLEGQPMDAFLVRKEAKGHGTKKQVEGPLAPGSRVVIVEDTVTTGESPLKAVAAVKELDCEVAAVVVVIDRSEGARERVEGEGIKFMPLFTVKDLGL